MTRKTYLEPEEVSATEAATTNLRDRLLIRLLFRTGCRISEALALSPEDINLEEGTVAILHLKRSIKLSCPHCGRRLSMSSNFCAQCGVKVTAAISKEKDHRRQRIIPADKETLNLLKEYIKRGGVVKHQGKSLIFGINRHRAWQIVRDCAERAGLPKLVNPETGKTHHVSPHRLRDAFAVRAVKHDDSGDGLRMLQEHLGHVSFNTTARYRKVSGKEHREWYDRLWEDNSIG